MKAFVFPGQGAQFVGMGKDLYENNPLAKELFDKANDILGYKITDIMFEGTAEELKQTKVTQPAVFLHSVTYALLQGRDFITPDDIKYVAPSVLHHRLILTAEAEMEGYTPMKVAQRLTDNVEVPK